MPLEPALRDRLARRWPLAESSTGLALGEALLDAWSQAQRGYHDLQHLAEVLDRLDDLHPHTGHDARVTALAAWFHDAVYDAARDPEGRSADWARTALTGLVTDVEVEEVARLVLLTREHSPAPEDVDGIALCDADLAILAAAPERYEAYVAGVRQEYASVPDELFAQGRAEVLRHFLGREHVFASAAARSAWEADARRNATDELRRLETAVHSGAGAWVDADQQP
ncbi:hypothetical protein [Nocardioides yefusunii]|uniref:Metal-dependent HD superfamily phosphohydrolase n=1 Tax=Nocardioides yefusunii TaxID=2500546 RepID=A0ABW1QZ65_9ACTN|nr:hypothetical protein [Nocardioides yefusunii]